MREETSLKRGLGLWLTTFYGLGTILGAGIYILIGKVAGAAGLYAPIAFLVAGLIASFTALSFAELSARFPKSAGEAYYVRQGLRLPVLPAAVGWMVVLIGLTSAATMASGFVGYFHVFFEIGRPVIIIVFVLVMGVIVAWGIRQSAWVVTAITLVEVAGLILVIVMAGGMLEDIGGRLPELAPPPTEQAWLGILLGAFLAFYAFIGFEDMVNVAEEIDKPSRVLPPAIIMALAGSSLLYLLVAVVAVLSLSPAELDATEAPLAAVMTKAGHSDIAITLISLFAVINGALVQMIMASRIIYGLSKQGGAPKIFRRIHPVTRTPLPATALVVVIALGLALWRNTEDLARATSFMTLIVFALVNVSLIAVRLRDRKPVAGFRVPVAVPAAGIISCLALLAVEAIW